MATEPKQESFTNATAAHYQAIVRQESKIRELEYAEEVAKRRHTLCKKTREEAQASLHMLILDPSTNLPGLDFDPIERLADWRDVPLSVVIHDPAALKALETANITTLGELQSYIDSERPLTKIQGVGELAEAKMIEQLQAYWKLNPKD